MSTGASTSKSPAVPKAFQSPSNPTRRQRFKRGLKLGMPIFLGYVPVGMAFGVLARTLGFT
jgi:predicted branched-subunit amino acid permease